MLRSPSLDLGNSLMKVGLDGAPPKPIEEIFDYCPLTGVCHPHIGCTQLQAKRFDGCYQFRFYLRNPKVIAYVAERAIPIE